MLQKSYPLGAADLTNEIKEAKASGADTFIAGSYPPDTFMLAGTAITQGYNPKVYYTAVGTAFAEFGGDFKAKAEGVFGIGGWDPNLPGAQEYYKRQVALTGHAPDGWASPVTYASLQILEQAIEKAGTLDRKKVLDTIATGGPWDTISGPVDLKTHILEKQWGVGQWQNGQFVGVAPERHGRREADRVPQAGVVTGIAAAQSAQAQRPVRLAGPARSANDLLICPLIEVILGGVILGGLYALVAIGFNLQYGMARIVNLAYGEFLMCAAFAAFWMFTLFGVNPILGMSLSVPATFGANWLIYRVLMTPLARRARTRDQLEGETILATFGLLFVLRGAATIAFTANNRYYDYLGEPLHIMGFTFAANRVLAFAIACVIAAAVWLVLQFTRFGVALRALAIDPVGAELVGIDVRGFRRWPSPAAARSRPRQELW